MNEQKGRETVKDNDLFFILRGKRRIKERML